MTIGAVGIGCAALVVFGAFIAFIIISFEVITVRGVGHLFVFQSGYFQYGAGNSAAYGLGDYDAVRKLIVNDPVAGPLVNVATPTVTLFGIAGNYGVGTSTTFFGIGMVPEDRIRMQQWNEYDVATGAPRPVVITDEDTTRGVIGVGLARILGLCEKLKLADCPPQPRAEKTESLGPHEDFSALVERDLGSSATRAGAPPHLDLRTATATGSPNAVSLTVGAALPQGAKEIDDTYIGMHLTLAQQLLYGRGQHKATAIVLQLHRSEDISTVRQRLNEVFRDRGLKLEVKDFTEVIPIYTQVVAVLAWMFSFIAAIMAVIVLFTVTNTMSMAVMERTNEIGTVRAMGVRRSGILRQFLVEGLMLGAMGATAGIILAAIIAFFVNRAGLTWIPPGQATPLPLVLLLWGAWTLVLGTWFGVAAIATLASLLSANRAARMPVVDALRYV
jgi:putative ABC transport system permease protein